MSFVGDEGVVPGAFLVANAVVGIGRRGGARGG